MAFEVEYLPDFLNAQDQNRLLRELKDIRYIPKVGPNPYTGDRLSISSNLYYWMSKTGLPTLSILYEPF